MLQLRRNALRASQRLRSRQPIRHESSHNSPGHGPADHAHHAHAEPVNESFGRGFWIALTAVPVTFAFFKFSHDSGDPSAQPLLTRIIQEYCDYKDIWVQRNALHTKMVEEAAFDRNLFQSEPASKMIDLKFPEVFNTGSPYNVPAGHTANLSAVIAHYEAKNRETVAKVEARAKGKGLDRGEP